MKNIHVIPTDKPSRYWMSKVTNNLNFGNPDLESGICKFKNIYITSDEEIKEDYVIAYGVVIKVMMFDKETLYFVNGTKAKKEDCKKIILTTDQDLIADGVQSIDDEFLQWFVKNPSCKEVEVELFPKFSNKLYGIILPKEEPKQTDENGKLNFGAEFISSSNSKAQNIYITSDEEIRVGDWCYYLNNLGGGNSLCQAYKHSEDKRMLFDNGTHNREIGEGITPLIGECKKIILTTDQDLINDGVQAIPDEFLEWFVKNPTCENIEVRKIEDELISSKNPKIRFNALQDFPSFISAESLNNMIITYKYKIIIPKEEPKQTDENGKPLTYWGGLAEHKQETLEEVAVRLTDTEWLEQINKLVNLSNVTIDKRTDKNGNTIIKWSNNSKPKQETLEGLVGKMKITDDKVDLFAYSLGLKEGAKWQQERSFSKEEVLKHLNHLLLMPSSELDKFSDDEGMVTMKWFKQF